LAEIKKHSRTEMELLDVLGLSDDPLADYEQNFENEVMCATPDSSKTRATPSFEPAANVQSSKKRPAIANLPRSSKRATNTHRCLPTSRKFRVPYLSHEKFIERFKFVKNVGEGTYGCVACYICTATLKTVAVKMLKQKFAKQTTDTVWAVGMCLSEGALSPTALREVKMGQKMNHENVVRTNEVFWNPHDGLCLVLDYLESFDKYEYSSLSQIRKCMYGIFNGLAHIHSKGFIHRDVRPDNLLVSNCNDVIICDFSLGRQFEADLKAMTPHVSLNRYAAPEMLLGDAYGNAVDVWAAAVIFGTMLCGKTLFSEGNTCPRDELDQYRCIMSKLQCPSQTAQTPSGNRSGTRLRNDIMRDAFGLCENDELSLEQSQCLGLLEQCLSIDPSHRISATEALSHAFFRMNMESQDYTN